ncbi:amidase [Candidatus Poriferisodalis sp.]|uniref:amidase n=1 Tax=Candidatus Poriferisodalis sp. TaxID=3101277 RepID=UPI003B5D052E
MSESLTANNNFVPPTADEVREIAAAYGITLTADQAESHAGVIAGAVPAYSRLRELPEVRPDVKYPRTPGYRPPPEENPYNAWYWRCSVKGAPEGILAGKTVAIKDAVCVAGVPMMNGSALLDGFVPDIDATVVTRILDAGGEIVGKAVCENLCVTGGSNSAATGPVLNPHNPEYATAGSSSGCAALLVNGDCDMAIGGDQGGSIRMPSSWSGCYGLKPTYGLVPYTGAFGIEMTVDHLGPMARSTHDVALLLEAIAGRDPMDPRQRDDVVVQPYTEALIGDISDLTIGVMSEGFGWEGGSQDVDEVVRSAISNFDSLGANMIDISVPSHLDGFPVFLGMFAEGTFIQMFLCNGFGTGWNGYYPMAAMEHFGRGFKTKAHSLSATAQYLLIHGHYMMDRYNGQFYAMAQNQRPALRAAYDRALEEVDLLVMPTCAPEGVAMKHIADPTIEELFATGWTMGNNTSPFNLTGHPAISVPCGKHDGLPVGLMLVGKHFDEATVLRAAHAFESTGIYEM